MKEILTLITATLVVTSCCSPRNDLQQLPTSDLQLRRYELMYCLGKTQMSWDKQAPRTNAYDNVTANLQEKEAIEREIQRRGVTNYHWPPGETYPYMRDRCHCQCWVVTL